MTKNSNKIIRKRSIDLHVPYSPDDDRYEELVQTIVDNKAIVTKGEIDIAVIKSKIKPNNEALENAISELSAGKPQLVACTEYILFDKDKVRTQRDDTKEWLEDRTITEEDRDPQAFDEEN